MKELTEIVETGPDPDVDGVVRWRRVDIQEIIEDRFGIVYHEHTISKLLAGLAFPTSAPGRAIRHRTPK